MDQSSNYTTSSDDENPTMTRHNQPRGRQPKRLELDLSAVLNVDQKFQLQRVVTAIVDDMQKHIRDNFDQLSLGRVAPDQGINPPKAECTSIPNPRSEKYRHMYADSNPGQTTNPDLRKENVKPANQANQAPQANTATKEAKPLWKLPKSPEELREMYQKTETEVLISSLSELKRDTLANFSKWRINVLKRMQDIVIKNGGTPGNVGGHAPQAAGNSRRLGNAGRGRLPVPSGPGTCADVSSAALVRAYPPIYTPLKDCPKEKRALILHSMLLILLGMDQYSLHSRILLVRLTSALHVPMYVLLSDEVRVSQALSKIIQGIPIEEIVQKRAEEAKSSRRWKAGMANAATSGGPGALAAPLAAAGIGTVFGGFGLDTSTTAALLGPMNDSTVIVGTLFGLYGARQGSKTIDAHSKDVQDFGMIPLHGTGAAELIDPKDVPAEDRRMRVIIGIGGLLTNQDDFLEPWQILGQQNESYAMRWELEVLAKAGNALETLVKTSAWKDSKKELNAVSVYERLEKSFWPIGFMKTSKVIEHPWYMAMVRAEKAGGVLADVIINKLYGERPVSLIGYGLGGRIIYSCLMALSEKRAFGLVENVAIMGAPCPSEVRVWSAMKSVVAGRLINVFSKNDYMLGFLYRGGSWQFGVAGLQKIEGVPNVENLDVSEVVDNHLRYRYIVGCVLKRIGWEDVDYAEVAKQQQKLAAEIQLDKDLDEKRGQRQKSGVDVQKGKGKACAGDVGAMTDKVRDLKLDNK